jgi:hypothetical protein
MATIDHDEPPRDKKQAATIADIVVKRRQLFFQPDRKTKIAHANPIKRRDENDVLLIHTRRFIYLS